VSYKISPIPHGNFSQIVTLTSGGATTANPVPFDTDEVKLGITHSTSVNPSYIYCDTAGAYLITFSMVIVASAPNKHINVWLAVNGTNIARSNTVYELPLAGEALTTITCVNTFTAGQYFQVFWCSRDGASMTILATAAGTNPTTPVSPAVILTVNKISK